MATIMQSGKQRCDETCHSAKHAKCTCICGGKYHGASVRRDMQAERDEMAQIICKRAAVTVLAESHRQPVFDFTGENNEQA